MYNAWMTANPSEVKEEPSQCGREAELNMCNLGIQTPNPAEDDDAEPSVKIKQ